MKKITFIVMFVFLLTTSAVYAETIHQNIETDPIVLSGTGDDILLVDINPKDYPFLYFKCRTANYLTVQASNENGDEQSLIYGAGAYEGLRYIGNTYLDGSFTMLEVSGAKDWEAVFIPKINHLINKYAGPITVTGEGDAVFEVDGLGAMAEIELLNSGFTRITQYTEFGESDFIYYGADDYYSGKKKIKENYPIISVETDGGWTIHFYSQDFKKPESSVSYNFTFVQNDQKLEKANEQKEITPGNNEQNETDIIPAKVGTKVNCGDSFQFVFYYQPIMTKSQSYQTAVGKFLMFRVHITNMTTSAIDGLSDSSFKLHGNFNGVEQTFKLDTGSSFSTSYRWDIGQISDTYQPGIPVDTYLVFDVTGKADSWYLEFAPKSGNKTYCNVNISVPKINYAD